MITENQSAWLKEFLYSICQTDVDRNEIPEILETFRKLWHVAKAAKENTYQRSPRLMEALAAIKEPAE